MQEHLLYMGSEGEGESCVWYPEFDSGPGSQCLIGHTPEDNKGFFGEVTGSELITMSDLTSQMGVTQGTAQYLDSPWLKFYLDGRILFVAKRNIRYSISYNHLRDKGVIDGSKIITINGLQYRVGLLGGLNNGYKGTVGAGYNLSYTMRSEWNRLMYNVASDVGISTSWRKQGQIGDNWANYPQDGSADGLNTSGGGGAFSWCKEINPGDTRRYVSRGLRSIAYAGSYTPSTYAGYGWRPVLELVQ